MSDTRVCVCGHSVHDHTVLGMWPCEKCSCIGFATASDPLNAAAPVPPTPDIDKRIDGLVRELRYDLTGDDQTRRMIEVDEQKLRSLLRGALLHHDLPAPSPRAWRDIPKIVSELDRMELAVDKGSVGPSNLRAWVEDVLDLAVSRCGPVTHEGT